MVAAWLQLLSLWSFMQPGTFFRGSMTRDIKLKDQRLLAWGSLSMNSQPATCSQWHCTYSLRHAARHWIQPNGPCQACKNLRQHLLHADLSREQRPDLTHLGAASCSALSVPSLGSLWGGSGGVQFRTHWNEWLGSVGASSRLVVTILPKGCHKRTLMEAY